MTNDRSIEVWPINVEEREEFVTVRDTSHTIHATRRPASHSGQKLAEPASLGAWDQLPATAYRPHCADHF